MSLEDYLNNLLIAQSPQAQSTFNDKKEPVAKQALDRLYATPIPTMANILTILESCERFPKECVFLSFHVLRNIMIKGYWDFEKLDQAELFRFSDRFSCLIQLSKFDFQPMYILAQTVITLGIHFNSPFVIELDKAAYKTIEERNSPEHIILSLKIADSLARFYQDQYKNNYYEVQRANFYERYNLIILPYFQDYQNFQNYLIHKKIMKLYYSFNFYYFNDFLQNQTIISIMFDFIQNQNNYQNHCSFDKILKATIQALFIIINSGNAQIMPEKTLFLKKILPVSLKLFKDTCLNLPQILPNNFREISSLCIFTISIFFEKYGFESYFTEGSNEEKESVFLSLINICTIYVQLDQEELEDFNINIFNYYCSAFQISSSNNKQPRLSAVRLLRHLCKKNEDLVINYILKMPPNEGIIYLIAKIIKNLKNDSSIQLVHKYVNALLRFLQHSNNRRYNNQNEFIILFLAAKSVHLLSDQENTLLLAIANSLILYNSARVDGKSMILETTPVACFSFTIASEILFALVKRYKNLPPGTLQTLLANINCCFSNKAVHCASIIGKMNPDDLKVSQEIIVQHLMSQLLLISKAHQNIEPSDEIGIRFDDYLICLANQAIYHHSSFPVQDLINLIKYLIENELPDFCPSYIKIFNAIVKGDNGAELVVFYIVDSMLRSSNLGMFFFEIAQPVIYFVGKNPQIFIQSHEIWQRAFYVVIEAITTFVWETVSTSIQAQLYDDLKDLIACTTLLARMLQALGKDTPADLVDQSFAIANNYLNNFPSCSFIEFIMFEVIASLALCGENGMRLLYPNMKGVVEGMLTICQSGMLQTNYYRALYAYALMVFIEIMQRDGGDHHILDDAVQALITDSIPLNKNFRDECRDYFEFSKFKSPVEIIVEQKIPNFQWQNNSPEEEEEESEETNDE